ncbi:hypothetical protein [Dapis sp. BLCC M172]|uniref:hypothetical protein n=1 Tax=Dapis sp. BLCC M172 TaxID=2975281 RepID=UPI003CE8703F
MLVYPVINPRGNLWHSSQLTILRRLKICFLQEANLFHCRLAIDFTKLSLYHLYKLALTINQLTGL